MPTLDDIPADEIDDDNIDDQDDTIEGESGNDDDSGNDGEDDGANDDGELVIQIGDEDDDEDTKHKADDSALLHDLRNVLRDKNKELKELRTKTAEKPAPDIVLGKKPARPTLEDDGIDGDPDKHEEALDKWQEDVDQWTKDKATVAAQDEKKQDAEDKAIADHQASLKVYNTQKAELKVDDGAFIDAQNNAKDVLSDDQQGLLLAGSENAAKMILGLGTNPAALKKLAAIKNPAKFCVELGRLQTTMKTQRKGPPPPEEGLGSSNAPTGRNDRTLVRLEKAADKSGDRSAVVAYKRERKKAARA